MKITLFTIALGLTLLMGCGNAGVKKSCVPNHEHNGIGLLVSKTSAHPTTFDIEVCYLNNPLNRTVTVYGVINENDIYSVNPNARWRFKNIDLNTEEKVTVEFALDDNYFAIFKDAFSGLLETNSLVIYGPLYQ